MDWVLFILLISRREYCVLLGVYTDIFHGTGATHIIIVLEWPVSWLWFVYVLKGRKYVLKVENSEGLLVSADICCPILVIRKTAKIPFWWSTAQLEVEVICYVNQVQKVICCMWQSFSSRNEPIVLGMGTVWSSFPGACKAEYPCVADYH